MLGVVECIRTIWRRVVLEIALHGTGLIRRQWEDVREPSTREDDRLASLLRLVLIGHVVANRRVDLDLRSPNNRHIRTSARKAGVEPPRAAVGVTGIEAGAVDAHAAVTRDTVIARAVDYRDAHHAELHVLVALALLVSWSKVVLVVAVGGRDDFRCGVAAAGRWTFVGTCPIGPGVRIGSVLVRVVAASRGAV